MALVDEGNHIEASQKSSPFSPWWLLEKDHGPTSTDDKKVRDGTARQAMGGEFGWNCPYVLPLPLGGPCFCIQHAKVPRVQPQWPRSLPSLQVQTSCSVQRHSSGEMNLKGLETTSHHGKATTSAWWFTQSFLIHPHSMQRSSKILLIFSARPME